VHLLAGDKAVAMTGVIAEVFPDASYQRCAVRFHSNVLTKVLKSRRAKASTMLKTAHVREFMGASMKKAGRWPPSWMP